MKRFIKIVTDILLVIVLVIAAVLYIPRLMGLKTYKVLSGSMEPEYHCWKCCICGEIIN